MKSLNIKDYTLSNFEIHPVRGLHGHFFIMAKKTGIVYMHMDGSLHDFCGSSNFFTKTKARMILDKVFSKYPLDDKLFEI
jgi:hypothetical protein